MAICAAQRQGANHLEFTNTNLTGKRKDSATNSYHKNGIRCSNESRIIQGQGFLLRRTVGGLVIRFCITTESSLGHRAELDTRWWYDLRRTWATMAAKNRVDMIQISKQLGHRSMIITEQHYAHFHPDYMGKAQEHSNRMLQNFL